MRAPLRRILAANLIAHRGLHDAAAGRIENSASAFRAAIARGYAIETDVRAALGCEPVIFHDAKLDRLTGSSGPVCAVPADQLAHTRLCGGPDTIPTLAGFLRLVRGRVPVFLEIKSGWPSPPRFLDKIAVTLASYRGPLAVMSFDPAVLLHFRLKRPQTPCGLGVSRTHRPYPLRRGIEMAAPHFLAVEQEALHQPHLTQLCCARGLPAVVWTVTSPAAARSHLRDGRAVIFEGFHPGRVTRMY